MNVNDLDGSALLWWWMKRVGGTLIAVVIVLAAGCPPYNVWSQKLEGEAVLAHAHAARMVLVTQAEAELEAATRRAKATEIVGAAAKAFPEYRSQEFIGAFGEALHSGKISQIIYVPTEANIPIIEAGRIAHGDKTKP
jgi:hypothetical protein